ncbi:MAG: transporter substrate-binding domain-containing protein [Desulfobacterales bacterium]|nr:transporter substrate-binding domain-containing protein [Desulfobacterales bacterium]
MTDKTGAFVGFDIDMAKEMAKAMNVKFVPVNTAWDGIIPALLTKKFDIIMSGMTVTQERNLKINFADPYIVGRPDRHHQQEARGQDQVLQGPQRRQVHRHLQARHHRRAVGQTPDPQGPVQVLRGRSDRRHGSRHAARPMPLSTICPSAWSSWPSRARPASWCSWTSPSRMSPWPGPSARAIPIS